MRCVRINRVFEIWYDKKNLFIYEEIKKIKRKRSFPNSETGSTREYNSWLPIFDKKKKKEKKSTVCQPRRSSNLSARRMDASLHRNRINLHCVARWTSSWDIYVCIALSYLPNNWAGWSHDEKNTLLDEIVEKCPSLAVEFLFIFLKRYLPSMLIDPRKFYTEIIDVIWYWIRAYACRVFLTDRKFIGKLSNRRISPEMKFYLWYL